jgi:cytosine/adenosine deaminase-related metal-dependent hydrolase
MPRVARAMIEVAKMRAMTVAPNAHIPTPAESWTTITRGNAEALGWNDAGRLEVGAAADLLILQPPFNWDEHFIGRLIYTWHDDVIALRIVNGSLETPKRRPVEATS